MASDACWQLRSAGGTRPATLGFVRSGAGWKGAVDGGSLAAGVGAGGGSAGGVSGGCCWVTGALNGRRRSAPPATSLLQPKRVAPAATATTVSGFETNDFMF